MVVVPTGECTKTMELHAFKEWIVIYIIKKVDFKQSQIKF